MRALTILSGLSKGKVFPLSGEQVTVGRADDNQIVLDDNDVSRNHVVFVSEGDGYRLKDLQSRNGTRVNGQLIKEKLLTPGDRVQIGLVESRYETAKPAVAPQPPPSPAPAPAPPSPQITIRTTGVRTIEPSRVVSEAGVEAKRLTGELTLLRTELDQARQKAAQLEALSKRNQELTTETARLREKLEADEQQLTLSRQSIETHRQTTERQATEIKRLDAELTTARVALEQAGKVAADVASLHREKETLTGQIGALRQQLSAAAQQSAGLQSDLNEARTVLTGKEATLDSTRQQLAGLKLELSNAQTTVAGKVAELARLSVERDAALDDVAQLRRDVADSRQLQASMASADEPDTEQIAALNAGLERAQSELAGKAEEVTRLAAELAASRSECEANRVQLEVAQAGAGRLEELYRQNAQLHEALSSARNEAAENRKKLAEAERHTTALQGQLTMAGQQIARRDSAQVAGLREDFERLRAEVAGKDAEIARLSGESAGVRAAADSARVEREQSVQRAIQAEELAQERMRLHDELAAKSEQAQQAAASRVEDLERQNQDLKKLLESEQQVERETLARAKEVSRQHERVATELASAQEQLAAVRRQLGEPPVVKRPTVEAELVTRESKRPSLLSLLKRAAEAQAREDAGEAEVLPVELVEGVTETERTQMRSAIVEARGQLALVGDVGPSGMGLTENKQRLAARLDGLERRLAGGVREPAELRRMRDELAEVRAMLFGLVSETTRGRPATQVTGVAVSAGKESGLRWPIWLIGAVIVLGLSVAVVMMWRGDGETQGTVSVPTFTPSANAQTPTPAATVEELPVYKDPAGRFTVPVPRGWTVKTDPDPVRSVARLQSGTDEIRVISSGKDWPNLTQSDQDSAERYIAGLVRMVDVGGLYANIQSRQWRTDVNRVLAFQVDMEVAISGATWKLRIVYFRSAGRENAVMLIVRDRNQEAFLELMFERVLTAFRSLPDATPAALATAGG